MTAVWRGVAGYAKYALNDVSSFAGPRGRLRRSGRVYDGGGPESLGNDSHIRIQAFPSLILRANTGTTSSNISSFDGDTPFSRTNQATVAMGVIVTF